MPSLHRALVLSATTTLGADIARLLRSEHIHVQSMHAWNEPIPEDLHPPHVLWTTGSPQDADSLRRACAGCDAVFMVPDLTAPLRDILSSMRTALHTLRSVTLSRTIILLPNTTAACDPHNPHRLDPSRRIIPHKNLDDHTRKAYHIELEVLFHIAHSFPAILLLHSPLLSPSPTQRPSLPLQTLLSLYASTPSIPPPNTGITSLIDSRDVAEYALRACLHTQPNDRILLPAHTPTTPHLFTSLRTSRFPSVPPAIFRAALQGAAALSNTPNHTLHTAHTTQLQRSLYAAPHPHDTPHADRLHTSLRPLEDTLKALQTHLQASGTLF